MDAKRLGKARLCGPVLAALFAASPVAHGAWPRTKADFAALPKYCAARSASKLPWVPEAQYDLWRKRMGPDFLHVHHYCAGLFMLNLARRATSPSDRSALLRGALDQMDYTRHHASRTFLLQPEIHTQMGRIQAELGNAAAAMELFRSAITLRPTYTPAYAGLADVLLKAGQREEARKVLRRGLAHRPESKLLRRRLARLDKAKP